MVGDGWVLTSLGVVLIALGCFSAFFFRDPARRIPEGEGLVVSPCDGTVMEVVEEDGSRVVRVFLSVFNVHLQRSPLAGTVKGVEYRPGRFLPAMMAEAHSVNEQNVITLQTEYGDVVVKQIAGLIARRVVAWCGAGDSLGRGEKLGVIRFGSQVDLYLPMTADIRVRVGDKVVGGETVFAVFPS